MDATTKKLLNLLGSDDLELRVAAAQVFSELGISTRLSGIVSGNPMSPCNWLL